MASVIGYNFPFLNESNVLSPQADERIIKNDLKQLLLTRPGERVMRPDFGTPIRDTVFEPLDNPTLVILRNGIKSAIDRFEPRVRVREIKLNTNVDTGYLEVIVFASLTRDPNRIISVDIALVAAPATQPRQAV